MLFTIKSPSITIKKNQQVRSPFGCVLPKPYFHIGNALSFSIYVAVIKALYTFSRFCIRLQHRTLNKKTLWLTVFKKVNLQFEFSRIIFLSRNRPETKLHIYRLGDISMSFKILVDDTWLYPQSEESLSEVTNHPS